VNFFQPHALTRSTYSCAQDGSSYNGKMMIQSRIVMLITHPGEGGGVGMQIHKKVLATLHCVPTSLHVGNVLCVTHGLHEGWCRACLRPKDPNNTLFQKATHCNTSACHTWISHPQLNAHRVFSAYLCVMRPGCRLEARAQGGRQASCVGSCHQSWWSVLCTGTRALLGFLCCGTAPLNLGMTAD
jgi:hypothetical protein